MKKYDVRWAVEYTNDDQIEHPSVSLEADSPKQAYALFLDSETTVRNVEVIVVWGMFGFQKFSDHIGAEDQRPQKGSGGSGGKAKQASVASSSSTRQEQILLRIESKLSQIHWTVLGVGMMFALVFIITPQCSQM